MVWVIKWEWGLLAAEGGREGIGVGVGLHAAADLAQGLFLQAGEVGGVRSRLGRHPPRVADVRAVLEFALSPWVATVPIRCVCLPGMVEP